MNKASLNRMPRIEDLARAARKRVPAMALGYLESGTGEEIALRRNREALDNITIPPRYLKPVGDRSCRVDLFGRSYDLPIGISPVGLANAMWPGTDSMLAAAARAANVPYGLSTVATTSIETIAGIAPDHLWFQLYVAQQDEVTFDLMDRARNAGVEVLQVTVDVPVNSKRVRDVRNGFQLPLRPSPRMMLDLAMHPRWLLASARAGMPRFETLEKYAPPGSGAPSLAAYVSEHITDRLDAGWLRRLRDAWPGKFVIKGIMTADAAREAADIGADGIVVSNHGARQFDATPASIEVLPEVVAAVGDRLTVMMDSGIRSGEDVLRAFSLGADYVFSGRSFVYAAAAAGAAGAEHAFTIFRDDLLRGMAQLGITDLGQLHPSRGGTAFAPLPRTGRQVV